MVELYLRTSRGGDIITINNLFIKTMKEKLFIWFMTTTRWRAGVPQFFYNAELSDLENPTNSDWNI